MSDMRYWFARDNTVVLVIEYVNILDDEGNVLDVLVTNTTSCLLLVLGGSEPNIIEPEEWEALRVRAENRRAGLTVTAERRAL